MQIFDRESNENSQFVAQFLSRIINLKFSVLVIVNLISKPLKSMHEIMKYSKMHIAIYILEQDIWHNTDIFQVSNSCELSWPLKLNLFSSRSCYFNFHQYSYTNNCKDTINFYPVLLSTITFDRIDLYEFQIVSACYIKLK